MKRKIGGKASGLKWLKENRDLGFVVPEFRVIDTSYYDEYARIQESTRLVSALASVCSGSETHAFFNPPQRLEEKCNAIARHFNGKAISVRSSAVVSEDNENISGAGIYDTFFLDAEQITPKNLLEKVLQVYASVNSERAIAYRMENGVKGEQMAVIVQKVVEGYGYAHGVVKSRLPARAGVIPVSWSDVRGAVVGNLPAKIHTAYFHATKKMHYGNKCIFMTEDALYEKMYALDSLLVSFIPLLRKRYGREFEAEFAFDFEGRRVYLLQIRELTNIQDKQISFPKNKRALFVTNICIGAGEYVGETRFIEDIYEGWDEPEHYVYIAPILRQSGRIDINYDELTPKKRAMILTHQSNPDAHALNIANERGLLCICADVVSSKQEACYERLKRAGPYVHIVSDGLQGKVYQATQEEAEAFNQRFAPQMARI